MLPALFPTRIRYGGLSVTFNLFASAFGGTTSTVVGALVLTTRDLNWPGYYLVLAGVVGLERFAEGLAASHVPQSPLRSALALASRLASGLNVTRGPQTMVIAFRDSSGCGLIPSTVRPLSTRVRELGALSGRLRWRREIWAPPGAHRSETRSARLPRRVRRHTW